MVTLSEIKAKAKPYKNRTGSLQVAIDKAGFARGVEELEKSLDAYHQRSVAQKLSRRAESIFRASILRPQEQEQASAPRRMSGRFTFGRDTGGGSFASGTFVTTTFSENGVQGFGYPDVDRADRRTNFVWRSLEWGLGAGATDHEYAPRGTFKLPNQGYWVDPSTGKWTKSVRGRRSDLYRPKGAAIPSPDSGIEPKFFITQAWESVVAEIPRDYQRIATKVADQSFSS